MGLCKCPKRRVTNQFCFEHRVNVCEHCMVQKHPNVSPNFHLDLLTYSSDSTTNSETTKSSLHEYFDRLQQVLQVFSFFQCVVQSYLQWLQDSDYNPNCAFCDEELANESCVRLSCYRKFTSHNVYCLILAKTETNYGCMGTKRVQVH